MIDADALGDITVTINGTVFVRYEDIMNEPTIFNENDLTEIRDRFGNFVRFVVEDIMRGKEERWGDEVSEDNQDIVIADEAYAEYKANPKTYTLDEIIEKRPTAEKRGRWIKRSLKDWSGGGATICSKCNTGYSFGAFLDVEDFNYCPNCGARMDKESK